LYPWAAIDGEELAEAPVLFEKEFGFPPNVKHIVRVGGILF
jgi:hypothetical protein